MKVTALDHVNIRTRDVASSAEFYASLLGFRIGPPPGFSQAQACWLYDAADNPIIHLRHYETPPGDTGPFDHFALRCVGKAELIARLRERDLPHQVHVLPDGRTVILIRDPHGVQLELNFLPE